MKNQSEQYTRYFSYVMLIIAAVLILSGVYLLFTHPSSKIDAVQMVAMGVIVFGISPGMYKKN